MQGDKHFTMVSIHKSRKIYNKSESALDKKDITYFFSELTQK